MSIIKILVCKKTLSKWRIKRKYQYTILKYINKSKHFIYESFSSLQMINIFSNDGNRNKAFCDWKMIRMCSNLVLVIPDYVISFSLKLFYSWNANPISDSLSLAFCLLFSILRSRLKLIIIYVSNHHKVDYVNEGYYVLMSNLWMC